MLLRNALLVLGVLTLIAGAVLAVLWIRLPPVPERVANPNPNTPPAILVAAQDLPAGTLLRAGQMSWMQVEPSAVMPNDLVRGQVSESDFLGAVTKRRFADGEPLRADQLVRAGERNFLAAVLSPGMEAVSLSVDASQSVAGLIQPGDRVDAILAQSMNDSTGGASAVGETVLHDVRVVAVDQWYSPATKITDADRRLATADSRIPKTITLELSEIDVKRLLVAAQLGKVTLVARALEGSPAILLEASRGAEPVWAREVSAAFGGGRPSGVAATVGSSGMQAAVRIMRGAKTETQ